MHTTEPAISQDAAGQGTAQQPGVDPRRSMAIGVLTGVALLCYLGNLFVVCPRPTAAGPGDND